MWEDIPDPAANSLRDQALRPKVSKAWKRLGANLGMFGIDQFTAIINPPHRYSGGGEQVEPVFVKGQVEGRLLMKMTLSADHRAVDGALVGAFLAT